MRVTASRVAVERDEGRQASVVDALFTATQRRVLACQCVLERPRMWVFGDEAALEAVASRG